MGLSNLYLYLLLINNILLILSLASAHNVTTTTTSDSHIQKHVIVDISLILDFDSSIGSIANSCISMAFSDFYTTNPHYTTRLAIHPKNSNHVVSAASPDAAFELVNEEQVVISFSITSSSLWLSETSPYVVQTTLPDANYQLEGITSLVQGLGWHDVVVLYEDDTETFIPFLTHAFQHASIRVSYMSAIPTPASVSHIKKELRRLRSMQTRVFLVHMTSPDLASRLFSLAHEVGLMSKDTAWIITDALSNSLSSLDAATIESMEGVLGIRPKSQKLDDFKIKWNTQNFLLMQQQPDHTNKLSRDIDMTCLQSYNTFWALATAVEKLAFHKVERSSELLVSSSSSSAIKSLKASDIGPRLVDEMLKHERLENTPPTFEIINIIGKGDRTVGYWTPRRGFSRKIGATEEGHEVVAYPNLADSSVFKTILWPGDSTKKPKGWDVPSMGLKLRWRE